MFGKNKKIKFQPFSIQAENLFDHPTPAVKHIPSWYKNQKLYSNGESDYVKANKKSEFKATFKLCTPLVDTITSGYFITLPADVIVSSSPGSDKYLPHIDWQVSWEVADIQPQDALGNYPVPTGYNRAFFRWHADWIIKTPPGYSLWVTHPSHRYDLPFITINGFVDTDKHPNSLLLPFFIKEGFEGIIPAGTPIAQIIPIKRDEWKTEIEPFSQLTKDLALDRVNINLVRSYKYKYWTRKKYE